VGDAGFGRSGHSGYGHRRFGCRSHQRCREALTTGMVDRGLVRVKFGIFDVLALPPPQQREPEHHVGGRSGKQAPQRIAAAGVGGLVG
jgi:hypothetical protein